MEAHAAEAIFALSHLKFANQASLLHKMQDSVLESVHCWGYELRTKRHVKMIFNLNGQILKVVLN